MARASPKSLMPKNPFSHHAKHDKINAAVVGADVLTFFKELIPQNRIRAHLSPYPDNPAGNFLLVQVIVIHSAHAVVYSCKIGMDLLQPPTRSEICTHILSLTYQRRSGSWRTWELQVLAEHIDDNMPPFLMVDVGGEGRDWVIRQRHKRWLNRILWFWLWFRLLSPRAWTGHLCGLRDGGRLRRERGLEVSPP